MQKKTIKQVLDDMISRREYSVLQARTKLLKMGFIEQSVNNILSDYTQKGFLSDKRYAEERAWSLMRRGYGPLYVTQKLKLEGVAFQKEDYDWKEAYQVAKRKAGLREGLKLRQYLYRRGFVNGQVNTQD